MHYGVGLWVPEVGGRIDPGSEAHDMVMSIFGGMSKGERMRIQLRVRSAMAAQAAAEGRYLGGRPPYGYQLADAGPHPNPAKAADGKRLHQLEPDPLAAPVVLRIFTDYVNGAGLFAIAENLTRDGLPSPFGHDPDRNRHRASTKGVWSKVALRAILDNPRYTGRQVWNRQRRDEVLIDVEDVALGHEVNMRWNKEDDWVWSAKRVHEPIVPDELFEQARQLRSAAGKRAAVVTPRRKNTYVVSSLVQCGVCGRRMQGAWAHGRAYYRCRFPSEYADIQGRHPRSINVRESAILEGPDKGSPASSIPTASTTPAWRSPPPGNPTPAPTPVRTPTGRSSKIATPASPPTGPPSRPAPTPPSWASGSPRSRPSGAPPNAPSTRPPRDNGSPKKRYAHWSPPSATPSPPSGGPTPSTRLTPTAS